MQISKNKVVSLDYTLTDDQGQIIDRAQDGDFAYLHGAHNIIPGLEQALEGKTAGDEMPVTVEPAEAYGERNDALQEVVPREMFGQEEVEVGMQFHAQSPDGDMLIVTIIGVDGDRITVDGNHPLAGKTLTFAVKVIGVRDANEEEIAHGHVHGPEGHQH